MKLSKPLLALILIASALLLNAATSGSTPAPNPRAVPQSHREAAAEQKPTYTRAEQADSNSQWADALAVATPSRPTGGDPSTSPSPKTTDEERHWRIEEGHETRSLQVEERLVCLTAGLAVINALVMAIYFVTMLASIRATKATKLSGDAAKKAADTAQLAYWANYRPWVIVGAIQIGPGFGTGPIITFKIYNAGIVPGVLSGQEVRVIASEMQPDNEWIEPEVMFARRIAIAIPPNGSENVGFINREYKPDLSAQDWESIFQGRKWLYFYGMIHYRGTTSDPVPFYETGFGAWFQGGIDFPLAMQPMTSTKITYFR